MCRPCSRVSSPVLTTAVMPAGSVTATRPRSMRAAPTPPARATIIEPPYPGPAPPFARGGRPWPAPRAAARPPVPSAPVLTVAIDATPLLGARTGIGVAVSGMVRGTGRPP